MSSESPTFGDITKTDNYRNASAEAALIIFSSLKDRVVAMKLENLLSGTRAQDIMSAWESKINDPNQKFDKSLCHFH